MRPTGFSNSSISISLIACRGVACEPARSVSRNGTAPLQDERGKHALWIEGDPPFRVTIAVSSAGTETFDWRVDLRVAVDGGRTRHFPCALAGDEGNGSEIQGVARAAATFLLDELERNGNVASVGQLPAKVPPHVPVLLLSGDGTVQDLTAEARRLLGHSPEASIEPYFFSYVHKKNLRRVMHDFAHMVSRQKRRARWLLRLRTGNGRWRWYRARAKRILGPSDCTAHVRLRRL